MPHSKPCWTSRTSSLWRFSVFSVPSWITTLSRSRRTLAPRLTMPSVTMQPATLPTLVMRETAHRGLNVLGHFVDDRVVGDGDLVALADLATLRVGPHVEADQQRARR